MKQAFETFLLTVTIVERWVLAVGYVLMTGLLLIDTLGREFFGKGLFGANIYATNALIFAAMAGFGLATASGRHLRPRVADKAIPAAWRSAAARAGQIASGAILAAIAFAAAQFVWATWDFGESNQVTGLPLWPIQMALPIGFGLSALRHFAYAAWPDLAPAEAVAQE